MRFPTVVFLFSVLAPGSVAAQALAKVESQARKGWLGISVEADEGQPPQVVEVVPSSPAAKGGLRIGDIVLRVNGKEAGDIDAFIAKVQRMRAGQRVGLVVRRGDKKRELSCVLGVNPESRLARVERAAKSEHEAAKQKRKPGFLGVRLGDGMSITDVIKGTAAQKGGLKDGDVIVSVGGRKYDNLEQLVKSIQATGAGNKLRMKIRRGDRTMEMAVVLGGAPEGAPGGAAREREHGKSEKGEHGQGARGRANLDLSKLEAEIKKLEAEIEKMERGRRKAVRRAPEKSKPKSEKKKTEKKKAEKKKAEKKKAEKKKSKAPSVAVKWSSNLERAREMAKRTGRPVVVDFYADWCKPCKMLEKSFTSPNVAKILAASIPVRIDVDSNSRLADRFGVSTIPHVVVLDASGKKKGEFTGYLPAGTLAERLGKMVGRRSGGAKSAKNAKKKSAYGKKKSDYAKKKSDYAKKAEAAKKKAEKTGVTAQRRAYLQRAERAKRAAAEKKRAADRMKRARRDVARDKPNQQELRRALHDLLKSQRAMNKKLEALLKMLDKRGK